MLSSILSPTLPISLSSTRSLPTIFIFPCLRPAFHNSVPLSPRCSLSAVIVARPHTFTFFANPLSQMLRPFLHRRRCPSTRLMAACVRVINARVFFSTRIPHHHHSQSARVRFHQPVNAPPLAPRVSIGAL